MEIQNKNKLKDVLIISLIDTLSEIYALNYNCDKNKLNDHIINKLKEINIFDEDIESFDILKIKLRLNNFIKDNMIKQIENKNISIFDNFDDISNIGKGANGWVYKVYNPLDDCNYAIKKIGIDHGFSDVLNEVRTMARLNHPNVVRYYNSWIESSVVDKKLKLISYHNMEEDNLALISSDSVELEEEDYDKFIFIQMELCKCDLKKFLAQKKLSLEEKKMISIKILEGLKYVHESGLIHRDIKLRNIFVGFDNNIKIGDFGLAILQKNNDNHDVGTVGYTAPEILKGHDYDNKADLYSLGIVLLELFVDFKTNMEKVLTIKSIKEGKFEYENINIQKCILGLINDNPERRLSIDDVILFLS